jgi:hypothetical protein
MMPLHLRDVLSFKSHYAPEFLKVCTKGSAVILTIESVLVGDAASAELASNVTLPSGPRIGFGPYGPLVLSKSVTLSDIQIAALIDFLMTKRHHQLEHHLRTGAYKGGKASTYVHLTGDDAHLLDE